jgi:addiction module HigA family antidote
LPHPGERLREDFLPDLGITPYRLAKETGISITHVHGILGGELSITAPVAYRCSAYLGTIPEMWLRMQASYDQRAGYTEELPAELARIRMHPQAAEALAKPIP